jgi:hypothetical protein
MSTNRGLFQVLLKDVYDHILGFSANLYCQYYDKDDGLLSNEFNGGCTPSVIRLNNGMVSFPSIKGLVQFIPEKIRPQVPLSALYLEDVMVDGSLIKKTAGVYSISNQAKFVEISVSSPTMESLIIKISSIKLKDLMINGRTSINRVKSNSTDGCRGI